MSQPGALVPLIYAITWDDGPFTSPPVQRDRRESTAMFVPSSRGPEQTPVTPGLCLLCLCLELIQLDSYKSLRLFN